MRNYVDANFVHQRYSTASNWDRGNSRNNNNKNFIDIKDQLKPQNADPKVKFSIYFIQHEGERFFANDAHLTTLIDFIMIAGNTEWISTN